MKLLGNLLLTISLVAAMLSAATAYHGFLDDGSRGSFEEGPGEVARLKAAAGARVPDAEALAELDRRVAAGEISAEAYVAARRARTATLGAAEDEGGTRLTPERFDELRAEGVESVFLKSFSFGRWRHAWVFLLASLGLLTGSLLVRHADRLAIQAAGARTVDEQGSPEEALATMARRPVEVGAELKGLDSDAARLLTIRRAIEELQRDELPVFLDARARLVAKLGLGGYAELMDRFAAGERQLNRAWSAAADGVLAESVECLAASGRHLEEAHERLVAG